MVPFCLYLRRGVVGFVVVVVVLVVVVVVVEVVVVVVVVVVSSSGSSIAKTDGVDAGHFISSG